MLGKRESNNKYTVINTYGYLGKYQFGGAALTDLGYKKKRKWVGKNGMNSHKDFLNSGGDGIYFIVFSVDDLEKETDKLVKKGIKVIFSGKTQTVGFAAFDTGKVGNVCVELMQQLE